MKIANNVKKKRIIIESDWQEPITDRTQLDIQFARNVIFEAKRTGKWPTDEYEQPIHLKGCLNYTDMNRIEGNISLIQKLILEKAYIDLEIKDLKVTWSEGDVITINDLLRIIEATEHISKTTDNNISEDIQILKSRNFDFVSLNFIENMILKAYDVLKGLKYRFHIVGTFKSDQEILPLELEETENYDEKK